MSKSEGGGGWLVGRVCWVGERNLASLMETGSGASTHSLINTHMQRTDTSTHHSNGILKAM